MNTIDPILITKFIHALSNPIELNTKLDDITQLPETEYTYVGRTHYAHTVVVRAILPQVPLRSEDYVWESIVQICKPAENYNSTATIVPLSEHTAVHKVTACYIATKAAEFLLAGAYNSMAVQTANNHSYVLEVPFNREHRFYLRKLRE